MRATNEDYNYVCHCTNSEKKFSDSKIEKKRERDRKNQYDFLPSFYAYILFRSVYIYVCVFVNVQSKSAVSRKEKNERTYLREVTREKKEFYQPNSLHRRTYSLYQLIILSLTASE